MAVESATYVKDLNASNPASSDSLKEADDHLRLIKQVLKATFPNIAGPVTASHSELSAAFPIGGIIMWSGALNTIPAGWVLCTGQSHVRSDGKGSVYAPDLRDKFVVGAGLSYNYAVTGGAAQIVLTQDNLPHHTHFISVNGTVLADGAHSHTINDPGHDHIYLNVGISGNGPSNIAGSGFGYGRTSSNPTGISINSSGSHTHGLNLTAQAAAVGADVAHENRPPYIALGYIMKI